MDCSTPGLPVHHQLQEFTQTHVHWVGDVIQPSHPLSSPSPPVFHLSQHQGLFHWVSSSHQVAKVLEFQLQHQSFWVLPICSKHPGGLPGWGTPHLYIFLKVNLFSLVLECKRGHSGRQTHFNFRTFVLTVIFAWIILCQMSVYLTPSLYTSLCVCLLRCIQLFATSWL